MTYSRLMLQPVDKYRLLCALRCEIKEKTAVKDDLQAWTAAQHDYRLAEAIARPRRGVRAHKLIAYDWYFSQDSATPLAQLDEWIKEAQVSLKSPMAVQLPVG